MKDAKIHIDEQSGGDCGKKFSWRLFLWENENKGTVYRNSVNVGPDDNEDEALQLILHQAAQAMAAAIESKKEETECEK